MKKIISLLLLLLCNAAMAQKSGNAGQGSDWDKLDKTFIAFVDALLKKDKAAFLAMSRPEVDCMDCITSTESESEGYFVPAADFFETLSAKFSESAVYKAMLKKGYSFSVMEMNNSKYNDPSKKLKVYQVWVDTYLRNEWAEGHEGTSHSFQFVKVNGQFKFYGLTSVP